MPHCRDGALAEQSWKGPARRSKKNHNPTVARTKKSPHRKLIRMKKQRVLSQMKGQDKTPEKQLNEVEIGNLPKKNSE